MSKLYVYLFFGLISSAIIASDKPDNQKPDKKSPTLQDSTASDIEAGRKAADEPAQAPRTKCQQFIDGISPRAVVKALTYRVFAICGTVLSAYIFTNDAQKSFSIGGVNGGVATVLYYVYDRIWASKSFNKIIDKGSDKCKKQQ